MAKRKRHGANGGETATDVAPKKKSKATEPAKSTEKPLVPETIQLVAGSYDQVLHGMTAAVGAKGDVDFADTFLFNAHTSAVRCVAVSPVSAPAPGQTQKVLLASGSTDERINIYNLSAHPPSKKNQDVLAKVAPRPILENPKNREVGTLLHHASTVTALHFPTRSKLLSASEDSTIAVTRTRDWAVLSTIKVPKAKAHGRPSGDTAAFGATPAGVNEFAIHPSMKVMISVSKGERCIRLWNLVTGKKAGVLGFSREMLQEAGEGKYSSGEGRTVVWGSADGVDEYAVGFDRGVVVFGMDSVPKCIVVPSPPTKVHQLRYVTIDEEAGLSLLAVSTENGRIAFYSTKDDDLSAPKEEDDDEDDDGKSQPLKAAKLVGYVGGREAGVTSRIKDFVALPSAANKGTLYVAGASSEGKVRLWRLQTEELIAATAKAGSEGPMGKLLGTYETQNRITCLAGFVMVPRPEGAEDSEDEVDDESEEESDEGSDEE
ncbi:MAK11-like protein [Purpureocillium lavendulum]|uniref:MAK11-like protein n=1 Tax=Purpureocillium lavendulum TaxID=1247861 RepID=A0AB34FZJ0_9HYPO|nr:MAK11-like protein [Purpureocillium lavendulum]